MIFKIQDGRRDHVGFGKSVHQHSPCVWPHVCEQFCSDASNGFRVLIQNVSKMTKSKMAASEGVPPNKKNMTIHSPLGPGTYVRIFGLIG